MAERANSINKRKYCNNNTTRITITGDGKTGIGTDSPATLVHLNASEPVMRLTSANHGNGAGAIEFWKESASPADDDQIGHFRWASKDDGGNLMYFASISAYSDDVTNGSEDAKLSFKTMNNGSLSSGMMIMETGSIGVGTDTPTDTLDIRGTVVAPLFKGSINSTNIDIDGGTVDGTIIGGATPAAGTFTDLVANTSLTVGSVLTATSSGISITSIEASGTLTAAVVDINSGNIDNTVIGGTTALAGTFSTLTANTSIEASNSLTADNSGVTISSAEVSGTLTVATVDLNAGNIDNITFDKDINSNIIPFNMYEDKSVK